MNINTKETIVNALLGAMKKANKMNSIEEKREHYVAYLKNVISLLDLDEDVDPLSDEVYELISDNFLSIDKEKVSVFEAEGYIPWLNDNRANINWDFYNRYERYLLTVKKWKPKDVTSIMEYSDIIIDHMANPKSNNLFNKQGLVIGDIQSGKTANYTAVINKAIDAGYKIIIVLAGITKDLRNQTQNRLDSEVLGYQTKINSKGDTIGVGLIKPLNIEGLTFSDDEKNFGDMKKYFSTHTLDKDLNPIVAIVKKNKSVLENLLSFIKGSQKYCYTNGKLDIPVLIIDDEVDQASVNTSTGDKIDDASTINKMIRTILGSLNRYSYVGYTATPFANVFIDPDVDSDIYPKDFILHIPSSSDYCGVKEYFGVDIIANDDYTSDHTNDLVETIYDYEDLFKKDEKVEATTETNCLNTTLKEAIKSFIIASSIKKSRGIIGHNSMLIHIARYKSPSTTLKPLVSEYIGELYQKLKYEYDNEILEYENFWRKKFEKVSKHRLGNEYEDNWDNISKFLLETIESTMTNIKVLNGDSDDQIDYSSSKTGDYIVIGGDKLSRGLTLNGLVVSYYYRKSRMYDSLLQMGRWFGYRKGWLDVCRVYTTVRFMNDFISVGKVTQRFKEDVKNMYRQRLNPREVGQRIMYSPNLIPTSRNKMKSAAKAKVSFSGELQQIISFDPKAIKSNFDLTNNFIKKLGKGEVRQNNKVVFKNIKVDDVLSYLKEYKEYGDEFGYGQISIANWVRYIENLKNKGELINWTVVLNSIKSKILDRKETVGQYTIYKPARTLRYPGDSRKQTFYGVKVNSDPTDFKEFFEEGTVEYEEIKNYESSKDYPGFDSQHALMSIYVVDLYESIETGEFDKDKNAMKTKKGEMAYNGKSVCAPAIWFPKTQDYESSAVMYYVSKDYLQKMKKQDELEFGSDDE